VADLVGGRFEIQRIAFSGGMGSVHRALDRSTGEIVALKILRDMDATRFEREAGSLAELSHPNIVRYVAHGRTESGEPFIALRWVEGETLAMRLSRESLTIRETLVVGRQIAAALAVAHSRRIVHRDVKPANVILERRSLDSVILVDFGLARREGRSNFTKTGMTVGTPGYISPEAARGANELDARADVFALGCLLYRCMTGRNAFGGGDLVAILARVLLEPPPRLSDALPHAPEDLDDLIERMLAQEPDDRPPSGGAVATALAGIDPDASPRQSLHGETLGSDEQRWVSVIAVRPLESMTDAQTMETPVGQVDPVSTIAARFGARLETLVSGVRIALLSGATSAADQATVAGRCALAIRRATGLAIVVATGRASFEAGRSTIGEAVERAAKLLSATRRDDPTLVCDVTSRLLEGRFVLERSPAGHRLLSERAAHSARQLVGVETPFVGREVELARLASVWGQCVEERTARAALVVGEPGIGKSRLAHELRPILDEHEPLVLTARGDPMRTRSPFNLVADALARAAGVADDDLDLEAKRDRIRAFVARAVPEAERERVTVFAGELAGVFFASEDSAQLRAARSDAALMIDQLRRAWETLILSEAAKQPVVLLLDDLHVADLPSIKLIDGVLRRATELPLFVLAFARREVHEAFPKLWPTSALLEMTLGNLPAKACARIVSAVLGERADAKEIVERAGGNAFYLEEVIRSIAEGTRPSSPQGSMPDTVLAMVQARLENLEPEARQILRIASVFGETFWTAGVRALLEDDRSLEWLDVLRDRELVAFREPSRLAGQQELGFRQALVREAAYATLVERDRVLGHRLAAEWLERSGERDPAILAHHFELGGARDRAAEWWVRAAHRLFGASDLDAALRAAARAVACGASGAVLGDLRLVEAEIHGFRGEAAEAESGALDAMRSLPNGDDRWWAAASLLTITYGRRHRTEELLELSTTLLELVEAKPTSGRQMLAVLQIAAELRYSGHVETGRRLASSAESQATPELLTDPNVRAKVEQTRAILATFEGDLGGYLDHVQAAAVAFDEAGAIQNACAQMTNVGYGYAEIGLYAEAEAALREAMGRARTLGIDYFVAAAQQNLGLTLVRAGRPKEGAELALESAIAFDKQGNARLAHASRIYAALALAATGDTEAAIEQATLVARQTSPSARCYALAILATLRRGTDDALIAAQGAITILGDLEALEDGDIYARVACAETLQAAGRVDEARAMAQDAAKRVRDRARQIVKEPMRKAFLENISENVHALALAAELTRA
jgi:tetratricopeptide (TPR) repeat protein